MRSGVSKAGAWVHRAILIGGDAVILLGAFHLGLEYWVRKVGPNPGEFYPAAIICLVAYLLTLSMFDLYDIQRNYRSRQASTLTHILGAVVMAGVALSGLFYVMPGVKLPRGSFFIQMGLAIPFLYLWRVNFSRLRQEMLIPTRVLIVGAGEDGQIALDPFEACSGCVVRVRTGISPPPSPHVPAHQADNGRGLRRDWLSTGQSAPSGSRNPGSPGVAGAAVLPADSCGTE